MKALEILNTLSMPWCTNQDIMKIANLSSSTASKIKRTIEAEFRKKYPSKFIPSNCVPSKDVIKYFDIDIEFLKSLVYLDKELNNEPHE